MAPVTLFRVAGLSFMARCPSLSLWYETCTCRPRRPSSMLDLRLVEADRYLASKEAAKKPNRGLRFNKLVPPGAD